MAEIDILINPNDPLPINRQLGKQITWMIITGRLKSGEVLPSIRKLAEQLGIHMHTVRLAYQHLEEEGWIKTRQGLGSLVLPFDPTKKMMEPSAPSNMVGVILPDFNAFYAPVLKGIEEEARLLPALLVATQTYDEYGSMLRKLNQLISKGMDGILLLSTNDLGLDKLEKAVKLPPIVYVDSPDVGENHYSVQINSYEAGYKAAQHLIKHGHTEIGIVTCPPEWANGHLCYLGYRDALKDAGLMYHAEYTRVVLGFEMNYGYQAAVDLLSSKNKPTAIFAIADILAIGVMQAAKQNGKDVPGDLAVVGYNDIPLAGLVEPGLTTVTLPKYELGQTAMQILGKLIKGGALEKKSVVLQTDLVVRQSCGCQ